MIDRQRLIPAVILGALSLLALKVISWSEVSFDFTPLAEQVAPRSAKVDANGNYNPDDFRGWTQIWAKARQPYVPSLIEHTGSVTKGKPKEGEAAEAPAKDAPAKDAPAKDAPADAPRNRSAVMNQGERSASPAERALAERLGERREQIEARQRELDMREKLLETAEKKLEGRVGELRSVEDKLETKKDSSDGSEAQGIKKLVIMYENMKPRDAARVFDRLPSDVLVPVVLQMNPRKMSEVLASMSAEAAEKLTVALATRARAGAGGAVAAVPSSTPGSNELPAITPAAAPARRN
jgi:flagellar motility protein MotE (MotC chaperone)